MGVVRPVLPAQVHFMLRILVCLVLIPTMLLPSGVCICHYFTLPVCSSTASEDEFAQQYADGDGCTSDTQTQNHRQPCRDDNRDNHPPCGPGIKALLGSTQADFAGSLSRLSCIDSSIPVEIAALPCLAAAHASPHVPPDQRHPLYLSLLTLRI
jgi:hypothetical protein